MTDANQAALSPESRQWLESQGFHVENESIWRAALTHGSMAETTDYQRLEFLGDRVLGLAIADWLFHNNEGAEGTLSQRLNALVSRVTCAKVARSIGLPPHIRISKQARDDGGRKSDNILGDVMEALLGAQFLERGMAETASLIERLWQEPLIGGTGSRKHPKSALQEWAAGNNRRPPEYELLERSGPDHAARFTVEVRVHKVGAAKAIASSKQEAEKEAARNFMKEFG